MSTVTVDIVEWWQALDPETRQHKIDQLKAAEYPKLLDWWNSAGRP